MVSNYDGSTMTFPNKNQRFDCIWRRLKSLYNAPNAAELFIENNQPEFRAEYPTLVEQVLDNPVFRFISAAIFLVCASSLFLKISLIASLSYLPALLFVAFYQSIKNVFPKALSLPSVLAPAVYMLSTSAALYQFASNNRLDGLSQGAIGYGFILIWAVIQIRSPLTAFAYALFLTSAQLYAIFVFAPSLIAPKNYPEILLGVGIGLIINCLVRYFIRKNFFDTKMREKASFEKRKVRALLDHSAQGSLTISLGQDGILWVDEERSNAVEKIFGTLEKNRIDFKSFFLDRFSLPSSSKFALFQNIHAAIGCPLDFFNGNGLPEEVRISDGLGRTKVLSLRWGPVPDHKNEFVERLLLEINDISSTKKIEAELYKTLKEKRVIEITRAGKEQCLVFMRTQIQALKAITESTSKFPKHKAPDEIFIVIHSLKGSSQSLSLSEVTEAAHECESLLAILKKNVNHKVEFSEVNDAIQKIMNVLLEYSDVMSDLDWKNDDDRSVNISIFDFINLVKASPKAWQMFSKSNEYSSFRAAFDLSFPMMGDVLKDVAFTSKSLANRLGKEVPNLTVVGPEIRLHHESVEILKACFVHIFNNSLDHGIESGALRLRANKSLQGSIHVSFNSRKNSKIELIWSDDGKGLDLEKIRERALTLGIDVSELSPSQVAALIFRAEFSTSPEITDLSGRGIGLYAVAGMLSKLGGTMSVVLGEVLTNGNYNFSIALKLPDRCFVAPPSDHSLKYTAESFARSDTTEFEEISIAV